MNEKCQCYVRPKTAKTHYRNKVQKDGWCFYCKLCANRRLKDSNGKNRSQRLKGFKQYHQENKSQILTRKKQYYQDHLGEERARDCMKRSNKGQTVKQQYGEICMICGRELKFNSGRANNWVRHHISYDSEVLVIVCRACHSWMHGQAVVSNHIFKRQYKKDLAPYEFAKRVVALYEETI